MNSKDYITSIPDFPQKEVLFRDITSLMANGKAFREACDRVIDFARSVKVDVIVGPESHGFISGCPVAYELGVGFVPIRKPKKLPRETISVSYDLEYGSNELHVHRDGVKKGQRVLIADDLLATGSTADAAIQIVQELGGEVAGRVFLIELTGLKGREHLKDLDVFSLMSYEQWKQRGVSPSLEYG